MHVILLTRKSSDWTFHLFTEASETNLQDVSCACHALTGSREIFQLSLSAKDLFGTLCTYGAACTSAGSSQLQLRAGCNELARSSSWTRARGRVRLARRPDTGVCCANFEFRAIADVIEGRSTSVYRS